MEHPAYYFIFEIKYFPDFKNIQGVAKLCTWYPRKSVEVFLIAKFNSLVAYLNEFLMYKKTCITCVYVVYALFRSLQFFVVMYFSVVVGIGV